MDDRGSKRPTEHAATDDGFMRWICPKQGYEMECCDCGLVHALEWRVVQYESDDPESPYSILSDKNIQPGVIASMQADLAASQAALEAVKRERDELSAHVNDLRECVACSLFDIDPDGAQHTIDQNYTSFCLKRRNNPSKLSSARSGTRCGGNVRRYAIMGWLSYSGMGRENTTTKHARRAPKPSKQQSSRRNNHEQGMETAGQYRGG